MAWFNKTALYAAIERNNYDIIKLLLANDKINIYIKNVLFKRFNKITIIIFQYYFKSTILMEFNYIYI